MDYQTGLYFLNFMTVVFSINSNFYAIHLDKALFEEAQTSCEEDAGFLTNMPNDEEISEILKAIHNKGDQNSTTFWIGLKKDKGVCVEEDIPLKGFHWTVDNTADFVVNKWKEKPKSTCTNGLCGQLSVEYRGTVIVSWGLAASHCKQKYAFICKQERKGDIKPCPEPQMQTTYDIIRKNKDPYTLQITCSGKTFTLTCSKSSHKWKLVDRPETDISEICLECQKGYKKNVNGTCEDIDECEQSHTCKYICTNTQGSYECGCMDDMGNFHKEDSEKCRTAKIMPPFPSPVDDMERTPTSHAVERQHPPTTNGTSNSTVIYTEDSSESTSKILVHMIVALLILVVLMVLIAAMARCCYMKRSKNLAKRRAESSKEGVALNGSDSVEKVNEK
ncbi:C-type lectin domain family 14 member A [Brachyhypopomus gauderio]|uniref:C-type lectin domain family 14 member A n=1 Tax=Brachyhypopomus gauderio TaxID=698409 RepID=UPI004042FFBA